MDHSSNIRILDPSSSSSRRRLLADEAADDQSRKSSSSRRSHHKLERRSQSVRNFGSSSGTSTKRIRKTENKKTLSSRTLGGLEMERSNKMERRSQSVRNFGSSSSGNSTRRMRTEKSQSSRALGGMEKSKRSSSGKSVSSKGSRKSTRSSSSRRKLLETDNGNKSSRSSRRQLMEDTASRSSRRQLMEDTASRSSRRQLMEDTASRSSRRLLGDTASRSSRRLLMEDTNKVERRLSTESVESFKSFDLEIDMNEATMMVDNLDSSSSSSSESSDDNGFWVRSTTRKRGGSGSSVRSNSRRMRINRRPSIDSIDEETVLEDGPLLDDADLESLLNVRTKLKTIPILGPAPLDTSQRTFMSAHTLNSAYSRRSEERMAADAAFLLYTRTEKAALQIQQAFRKRHPELNPDVGKPSSSDDDTKRPSESSRSGDTLLEEKNDEERDKSQLYSTLFFGAVTMLCWGSAIIGQFFEWFGRCCGNGNDGGVEDEVAVCANMTKDGAATGGGGGGGGGGQAAQGAQGPAQAMAGQAASAAGSAASSGVAAAGAAAAAAAGAAAAGGLMASIASALGVTAAVATVAGVATAMVISTSGGNNNITVVSEAPPPIVSSCGLVDPTVRPARVSFWMEGFSQEFDARESVLLEGLLVEAYNNITVGDGCSDKFLRELNGAKMVKQVVFPANDVNNSFVETTFETVLFCDGCPEENPMFGGFEDNEVFRRNLRQQISQNSRRLEETLGSFQFFQQFIQQVMVGVKRLSDDEEISDGFIQMARGYITDDSDEDEDEGSTTGSGGGSGQGGSSGGGGGSSGGGGSGGGGGGGAGGGGGGGGAGGGSSGSGGAAGGGSSQGLVTDINASFNQAGEIAAITFEFTVNGEKIVTTVDVAPATDVPTLTPTLFPTDQPSLVPTMSQRPSITNATYPPTDFPSSEPSGFPSAIPSAQPSSIPSVVPSEGPSLVPSAIPSMIPSDVPSDAPSDIPSDSPSSNPSSVPSSTPSARPSARPSSNPSLDPSFVPSESVQPSDVPSQVPSDQPSRRPTTSPSSRPTNHPTISNRPTPCIWTAAERRQSKSGNGPDETCMGIDYLTRGVPVYIIDQSQDGSDVTFRLHPRLFESNISSLAAMTYDNSESTTVCDVQTNTTFDHTRSFLGDCTDGELEVTFYLFMCGSENNVNQTTSTFCDTPSDMDNYYEYRYKLDCWEKCETEGPTSGPTSGPTVSMIPTTTPSAKPSSSPSASPTNRPTISKKPSAQPIITSPA